MQPDTALWVIGFNVSQLHACVHVRLAVCTRFDMRATRCPAVVHP